ncbi:metallophosphoesterase family protein [Levilactobacillus tangyuanensis]|uniref:Metallophosphoesterase family protein n=1 Tax=Levilactobacillus tangyuanensis TaxID=2486021 RepID=A0ABW1TQ35_9LACO|nr:metallophosphoesterase family protein [Levilactobacillus tangyuanensis]
MKLTTTGDQPFRICQLTDIHLGATPLNDASQQTLAAIDRLLASQSFDLIMLTGDLLWGKEVQRPDQTLTALYDTLNQYPIPVAVTYGNHDGEGPYTRAKLRELESLIRYPADKHHSMVINDRESYTLEINRDDRLDNVLYVWDSGAYAHWPSEEQYAAIEPEQIDWFYRLPYARTVDQVDLGFIHIPLPEYKLAANNIVTGGQNEPICSPETNSGLFYSLKRTGNVKALFAGHDHDNNFTGTTRGIDLNYGNVTGYNTYGTLPRGARTISVWSDHYETDVVLFPTAD